MLEFSKKIWNKIYNPSSANPDVEIEAVLDILCETMAESDWGPDNTNQLERYILAKTVIQQNIIADDVAYSYAYKVTPYWHYGEYDSEGRPKHRSNDEYEANIEKEVNKIKEVINVLVEKNLLVEDGDNLIPSNQLIENVKGD